jgi:hypothetical protein
LTLTNVNCGTIHEKKVVPISAFADILKARRLQVNEFKVTSNRIDPSTLKATLHASSRPSEVSEEEVNKSIRDIAEHAYRRTVMDQCGGLPGPPIEIPTLSRRLLQALERFSRQENMFP